MFCSCFIGSFSILRNSQLESDVCRLRIRVYAIREIKISLIGLLCLRPSKNVKFGTFHVIVAQRQQRNVWKSVMHVQSCCHHTALDEFSMFTGKFERLGGWFFVWLRWLTNHTNFQPFENNVHERYIVLYPEEGRELS